MGMKIEINVGDRTFHAELNDTTTAAAVGAILPLTTRMSRWGEEYYGEIPVDVPLSPDSKEIMDVGEVAYWPPGRALCFFFGRTPASTDHRPRAAGKVNPVGMITGTPGELSELGSSITARIMKTK